MSERQTFTFSGSPLKISNKKHFNKQDKQNCEIDNQNYMFEEKKYKRMNQIKKESGIQQPSLQDGEVELQYVNIYQDNDQSSNESQQSQEIDSQKQLSNKQQYIKQLQKKLNKSYKHNRNLQKQLIKYSIMFDDNKQLTTSQTTQISMDTSRRQKGKKLTINSQLKRQLCNNKKSFDKQQTFDIFEVDKNSVVAKQDDVEELASKKHQQSYLLRIKNQNKELIKVNRTLQMKNRKLQQIMTYINNQKKTLQDQYELFTTLVQKQLGIQETMKLRNYSNQQFQNGAQTSCGLNPFILISKPKQIKSNSKIMFQKNCQESVHNTKYQIIEIQ